MKTENDKYIPLSPTAQIAFENYPQIAASPDFNRRVLERVLIAHKPSRLELFCDRMDEIFARPVLKLLGAAFMGAAFALVGTGAILAFSGASPHAGNTPSAAPRSALIANDSRDIFADSLSPRNRMAWAREGFVPPSGSEYSQPEIQASKSPARREKSVSEMEDKRSSSCPAAFATEV